MITKQFGWLYSQSDFMYLRLETEKLQYPRALANTSNQTLLSSSLQRRFTAVNSISLVFCFCLYWIIRHQIDRCSDCPSVPVVNSCCMSCVQVKKNHTAPYRPREEHPHSTLRPSLTVCELIPASLHERLLFTAL